MRKPSQVARYTISYMNTLHIFITWKRHFLNQLTCNSSNIVSVFEFHWQFLPADFVCALVQLFAVMTNHFQRTNKQLCVRLPREHYSDVHWVETYFGGMFSGRLDQSATQSASFIRMSMSLSLSKTSSSDYTHTHTHIILRYAYDNHFFKTNEKLFVQWTHSHIHKSVFHFRKIHKNKHSLFPWCPDREQKRKKG